MAPPANPMAPASINIATMFNMMVLAFIRFAGVDLLFLLPGEFAR